MTLSKPNSAQSKISNTFSNTNSSHKKPSNTISSNINPTNINPTNINPTNTKPIFANNTALSDDQALAGVKTQTNGKYQGDAKTQVKAIDKNNNSSIRIAIIGGGLTGLITADLLEKSFENSNRSIIISIFEKSSGVGRLATRYKSPETGSPKTGNNPKEKWQFDFGAQFFTAKSKPFNDYLQPWLSSGVVEPWLAKTAQVTCYHSQHDLSTSHSSNSNQGKIELTGQWNSRQPRYIGSPKMTSFGRAIASNLQHTQIFYKTRVAPLTDQQNLNQETQLEDDQGNHLGVFDWVICTAPQAQAIELLANSTFVSNPAITEPKMLACYTLMLGWTNVENMPEALKQAEWDVLQVNYDDEISYNDQNNYDNQMKQYGSLSLIFVELNKPGRHDVLPSLTIHANNDWSEAHVDDDIEHVQQGMLNEVKKLLNWDKQTAPEHIDCHRWRYAATLPANSTNNTNNTNSTDKNAANSINPKVYLDSTKQWMVIGDWCHEGRIESCFAEANEAVALISNQSK